ncbi:unnamed protein product [Amoebophrya sp. A25]|nr:unnamed protein product [Amoebophrya sp. A25]|eukprot:GSA25T00010834001.1
MVDTVTDAKDEVVLLLADLCVDHTVAPLLVDDSRKLTGVGREDMDDPEAKYESVSTSSVSLANSECRDVEPNEVISSSEGKKSKASKSKTRTFTCFQLSRYPGRTLQKQSFFSVAGLFYVFFFLEFANVQSRMRRELLRGDGDRDTDVDENEALSAFAEVEEEQNQDRRFFDIFVNQDQRFIGNVTSFLQVDTSTLGAEAGGPVGAAGFCNRRHKASWRVYRNG